MGGGSVLSILEEMLNRIKNLLPKEGKVIIEYESGIPYMALGEKELAKVLGIDYKTLRSMHAKTVKKVTRINPIAIKRVGRGKLVVENIEDAIKVISLLRQNLFTVKAEVLIKEPKKKPKKVVDLEKLSTEYVKLLTYLESVARGEEELDDKLIKLWIQLATAMEILGRKVDEKTAHIFQVPFIPYATKEKKKD